MRKDESHTIVGPEGLPITVEVKRDKRLRKSARWLRETPEYILLRVPPHTNRQQITNLLDDICVALSKQRQRAERLTDAELQARAERINRKHFSSDITWESIRWVGNMRKRLGSCTNGGPTDGHIRISERIREWPDWVIDYIIAHELAHRVHPNHSKDFWCYLETAYPLTERARGFIQGVSYAGAIMFDEDDLTEDTELATK